MPDLFAKIQNADFQFPPFFSDDVKDLLSQILTNDPKNRISLDNIMQHTWFTKGGTLTTEDLLEAFPEGEVDENGGDGGIGTNVSLDENAQSGPAVPMTPRTAEAARLRDLEAQNSMTRTQSEAKVKRIFQFKTKGVGAEILATLGERYELKFFFCWNSSVNLFCLFFIVVFQSERNEVRTQGFSRRTSN